MMEEQSMSNDMPRLDEDGFPVETKKWTEEVSEILAENESKFLNSKLRGNGKMERRLIPGNMPELDEEGFLVDTKEWTEEVAETLAKGETPAGLTNDHWNVIAYIRQFYLEYRSAPPIRMIARRTGFSLLRLKELFPNGLLNTAWRYAGLPRKAVTTFFKYPH